jgi:broad specificity phosphatase PhoE
MGQMQKLSAPPGGETDLEMAERVLVVTSGGPLGAVQADAHGIDQAVARLRFERADNCAVIECIADARGLTLV